jgi:hypothetical protein
VEKPLGIAARYGHTELVEVLLDDPRTQIEPRRGGFATPFAWAVVNGHAEIIRLLLATGKLNVNVRFMGTQTLLCYTARRGDEARVRILVGVLGVDALGRVAKSGYEGIAGALMGVEGVDLEMRDVRGLMALAHTIHSKVSVSFGSRFFFGSWSGCRLLTQLSRAYKPRDNFIFYFSQTLSRNLSQVIPTQPNTRGKVPKRPATPP